MGGRALVGRVAGSGGGGGGWTYNRRTALGVWFEGESVRGVPCQGTSSSNSDAPGYRQTNSEMRKNKSTATYTSRETIYSSPAQTPKPTPSSLPAALTHLPTLPVPPLPNHRPQWLGRPRRARCIRHSQPGRRNDVLADDPAMPDNAHVGGRWHHGAGASHHADARRLAAHRRPGVNARRRIDGGARGVATSGGEKARGLMYMYRERDKISLLSGWMPAC